MPYASLAEVYGGDFGQVDPQKLAQNYGMRNIETYKQKGVPDSALPMEVGVTNMDVVKFNQQVSPTNRQVSPTNRQVSPTDRQVSPTDRQVSPTDRQQQREVDESNDEYNGQRWRGMGRRKEKVHHEYNDEPNFRYSTMRGVNDEGYEDEDGYNDVESFVPRGRSLHERFLEHFGQCSACREKVWEKFSNYVEKRQGTVGGVGGASGSDIREMFGSEDVPPAAEKANTTGGSSEGLAGDSYIDVVVMILLGIFIIFVLDAFVKLGRGLGSSGSSE